MFLGNFKISFYNLVVDCKEGVQTCVEDRQEQVDLDNLLVWIVMGCMEDALRNL